MVEHIMASVREILGRDLACVPDLVARLQRLRLIDALDRLAALLGGSPWHDAGTAQKEIAARSIAALDEFAAALEPLTRALDPAVVHSCREIEAGLALQFSLRFSWFRSAGEARQAAAASTAAGTAALPVPPSAAVEPLRFAARAPVSTSLGAPFLATFVAYPESELERAQELLGAASDRQTAGAGAGQMLSHGTVMEVAASGKGLLLDGEARSVQRLLWKGEPAPLQFEVELAEALDRTVLRFDVRVDGVTLARIRLELRATGPQAEQQAPQISAGHVPLRRAFASYASADRQRVLDRVASIRLLAGVKVFVDCHDLNPGELWEPRLAAEIDACDDFLLFWSDAAAQSHWVRWEWERALLRPGCERMQLHPLANGIQPPPALRALHFDDPYMDLRVADRLRRATTLEPGEPRA